MNLLFSCIGKRGYIADFFRPHLATGDRIIGTGNTRWTPGFRACDAAFLMPDIVDEHYLPAVLELCEREHVDAVLSFSDPDVYRLSQVRTQLEARGIVPLIPTAEVAEISYDKYRMFQFLSARGIATPKTALTVESAEDFTFPMYVKPRRGSGSHHTFLARDQRELDTFFNYAPDMIIQERAVGEEFDIEVCGGLDGSPLGLCTWRKLQSRLGETEAAQTFRDSAVIDFGVHLARLLRVPGPMDVDVVRTGESLTVLEANARFGGGYPVSHLAGADFPRILVGLIKGEPLEMNLSFAPDVVMMKRLDVIGGPHEPFFEHELGLVKEGLEKV
ncbi:MAG: ATP-grasp domain-containing protein [Luteitalea sp.]|nr:ATP-grasp domain-containing protein [Luteitalea sp.]